MKQITSVTCPGIATNSCHYILGAATIQLTCAFILLCIDYYNSFLWRLSSNSIQLTAIITECLSSSYLEQWLKWPCHANPSRQIMLISNPWMYHLQVGVFWLTEPWMALSDLITVFKHIYRAHARVYTVHMQIVHSLCFKFIVYVLKQLYSMHTYIEHMAHSDLTGMECTWARGCLFCVCPILLLCHGAWCLCLLVVHLWVCMMLCVYLTGGVHVCMHSA